LDKGNRRDQSTVFHWMSLLEAEVVARQVCCENLGFEKSREGASGGFPEKLDGPAKGESGRLEKNSSQRSAGQERARDRPGGRGEDLPVFGTLGLKNRSGQEGRREGAAYARRRIRYQGTGRHAKDSGKMFETGRIREGKGASKKELREEPRPSTKREGGEG